MGDVWKKFGSLLGKDKQGKLQETFEAPAGGHDGELWETVCAERAAFYADQLGPLPADILRIGHMLGVWPGGGLYVIPAEKIEHDAWAYISFGLSNADMPTNVQLSHASVQHDEQDRLAQASGTLTARPRAKLPAGVAGYGYELMVLAREQAEWPLWILQWAAEAEMLNDAGLLGRVDKYDGLTVENIRVGHNDRVHLLIAKASEPLPTAAKLSNGAMTLLIATVITEDEMKWSQEHGREALLDRLIAKGVGQFSVRGRPSVFSASADNPASLGFGRRAVDFSGVTSFEKAEVLAAQGHLEKIYLFPLEFGGQDIRPNLCFVPAGFRRAKAEADDKVLRLIQEGRVSQYRASPEYKGNSFVPARIVITASNDDGTGLFSSTIEVW